MPFARCNLKDFKTNLNAELANYYEKLSYTNMYCLQNN